MRERGIKNGNPVLAYLAGNTKRLTLKCSMLRFPSSVVTSTGTDIPSPPPHAITLHFHALNSIFSTYFSSLDGKQNHNVVSQSNGITSDRCHELVLKSYILNYIRYILGSRSLPWKAAVVCHVSNHTTSKKYSLYLFWAVLAKYSLRAHSPSVQYTAGQQK